MDCIAHNTQFFHYEMTRTKPFYNETLHRTLQSTAPQKKYFRRVNCIKTTIHWGQRKLLLSEIEFLTKYVKPGKSYNIVYAGAAPGIHTGMLTELFPRNKFILIDPEKFRVKSSDNIVIRRELFTNEIAEEYSELDNLLFISDIRSGKSSDHVSRDMEMQRKWVEIMNPMACMLKFRLPWLDPSLESEGKINDKYSMEYFDG